MFGLLGKLFSSNVPESKSSYKPILFICAASLLIFSIGYALKPVSEIIDELHDSNDDN